MLIIVSLLLTLGLVILYSTSIYNGRVRFGDPAYYFKKQLFASILGIGCMLIVSRLDYHRISDFATWLYLISLGLSLAVLFVGKEYNGSKRWLALGPLSFQPAEFAKIAVILLLASQISRSKSKKKGLRFILWVVLLVLPIVGLVGTNNLSTAIIILGIAVMLVFMANSNYLQFVGIGACGIAFMGVFLAMESYRLERLKIWQNPELYEKGFQTIQGLYAIGSGGLFGIGLGKSLQKLGFVPEAQNDMIFSIICEELGFVGASAVILVFGILLWRILIVALHAQDLLGMLICAGVFGHLSLQIILNLAVVTNSIPNTGITLPFISYGGTSILFLMMEIGLVLSVSAKEKRYLM